MIVELRTRAQAARVAELTGGVQLPLASKPEVLSTRVDVGPDFERHRAAVESVSVLFKLFDDDLQVHSGWTVTGAQFEVEWPSDPSAVRSHFGARRFAYNWALAAVKADIDAKAADPEHASTPWTLAALRKRWNAEKSATAPWWDANSKEAYSSGIADLVQALENWSSSKSGKRKGTRVGFPRFRSRHSDHARVRFTTGSMRLEPDRRHITLPVVGTLRTKENTRRVERHLRGGNARILNMTLSERWGRLFVGVSYAVRVRQPAEVSRKTTRVGIDLGLRTLATLADSDGNVVEVPNPAPLRATLNERRRASRELSRRIPGSRGHRAAKAKLARLDRKAVHVRREAWHQLTAQLVKQYGEIVIEDLYLAAMKKSMGRRAFRRSVSDAALGMFRPMLAYKAQRNGVAVVVADRWTATSQIHHGCGCRLVAPHGNKLEKRLACALSGELIDRDHNAACNLRDWPGHASSGPVGAWVPLVSSSRGSSGDGGSDAGTTRHRTRSRKTMSRKVQAATGETETDVTASAATEELREECLSA